MVHNMGLNNVTQGAFQVPQQVGVPWRQKEKVTVGERKAGREMVGE